MSDHVYVESNSDMEEGIVDDILDAATAEHETPYREDVAGRPSEGSPEWSSYVLSLLTEDEMPNGRPSTPGLRRVATFLYGPLSSSLTPHVVSQDYAACTVYVDVPASGARVHGSAECHDQNTDPPFSKYPLATAETRAEGRALKKVLCLENILTAEEASNVAAITIPVSTQDRTEGSITDTQIKFIDRMCKKLEVDLKEAVTQAVGPHEAINDLSHAEALKVNEVLDTWSREPSEPTPQYKKLGPYNSDWRTDFSR